MGKNLNTLSTLLKFHLTFLRFPDCPVAVLFPLQATSSFPKTSTITSLRLSRKTLSLSLTYPQAVFNCWYVPCTQKTKWNATSTYVTTIITIITNTSITATAASLLLILPLLLCLLSTIHCVYCVSGTGFSPYQQQPSIVIFTTTNNTYS